MWKRIKFASAKKNCETISRVQEQLDAPAQYTIPPGTYDVYETIRIPPGKRLVCTLGEVTLRGHCAPVLWVESPSCDNPVDGVIVEVVRVEGEGEEQKP